MATTTTNYNLAKPAYADRADIGVINDDLDAIDAQMKANADAAASADQKADEAKGIAQGARDVADQALTPQSNLDATHLINLVPDASIPPSAHDVIDCYIVGTAPLAASWLSLTEGGAPLTPQANRLYVILTTGSYYNQTFRWGGTAYVNVGKVTEFASQAEAEAGTDNTKAMTPLRTRQAIDATPDATVSAHGMMSASDKTKLDGIAAGAQVNTIESVKLGTTTLTPASKVVTIPLDSALDETSDNPVKNSAIAGAIGDLTDSVGDAVEDLQGQIDSLRDVVPEWDETAGCYTNESIVRWLDTFSDGGKVYGVKTPLYAYSPLTTGEKTGANVGLVLEASTETAVGRNDYENIKLFKCPRVNGGVAVGGMPCVTAIEGVQEDEHPFDETQNTYALTIPYYRRVTKDTQYKTKEISESWHEGFEACAGMFLPDGTTKRPYILRACYMDSDGTMDSKSGTVPSAWYSAATDNRVQHCANNEFSWSKGNTTNGLTYLTFGDIAWQEDFMEVMLGVKAPRSVVVGCVSYNYQYTVAEAETDVRRVILTDAQAANIEIGSSLSVGDNTQTDRYYASVHSIAKSAKVLSKEALGSGKTAINLDLDADITTTSTSRVTTMPWYNGTCDGVKGVFGARTTAALTNGKEPFKFQNVEWNLGLYETLCNMYSTAVNVDGQNTHTYHIAPDVSDCTGLNAGTGWTNLTQTVTGANNAWGYIKDYTSEKGANIPESVGGTSTTGYMTAWHPGNGNADRETLVGGNLNNGAAAGVGCVTSRDALSGAYWYIGGRSSAIGHAALAA